MKILPPTLRESNRYAAIVLVAEGTYTRRDLLNEILYCAAALLGDAGSSELGLRLLSFERNRGIIRCTGDRVWETRAVLASVSAIKNTRVRIDILGISGTVQSATEKYLLTQNKVKAEPGRERTIEECKIVINRSSIFGSVVKQDNDEIDLLPEDSQNKEIVNRSNTRYMGITVFDLENKERD